MQAQEKLYLIFELMQVDNEQEADYLDTERFWKKIHEQRLAGGEIIGWDLWQLLPGGENQGYQYLTVTLYNSPDKMFDVHEVFKYAKKAYPDMSDESLRDMVEGAGKTRNLAVRNFMEQIAVTDGDFEMNIGTIAFIDLMKVPMKGYDLYEAAEKDVFQPIHQDMVNNGWKGSWSLLRYIIPIGEATYASHMTVNMYSDVTQALTPHPFEESPSAASKEAIEEGFNTRELKYTYMARLIDKVR